MPWKVQEKDGEFCVVTKTTPSKTVACHPTREKADAQVKALYANTSPQEYAKASALERLEIDMALADVTPQELEEAVALARVKIRPYLAKRGKKVVPVVGSTQNREASSLKAKADAKEDPLEARTMLGPQTKSTKALGEQGARVGAYQGALPAAPKSKDNAVARFWKTMTAKPTMPSDQELDIEDQNLAQNQALQAIRHAKHADAQAAAAKSRLLAQERDLNERARTRVKTGMLDVPKAKRREDSPPAIEPSSDDPNTMPLDQLVQQINAAIVGGNMELAGDLAVILQQRRGQTPKGTPALRRVAAALSRPL
jgi:hypothetical protein